jgi:hypothetical protein
MKKPKPIVLTGFLIAVSSVASAQQPQPPKWTQAFTLFIECLQDLAARGNYTWTDGGASAMRLAEACQAYGKTVIGECMAMYFHPDEGTCRATNVLYAQTILKALHK